MTLIDAKFDAALINISEVTSRKTKWPRFFWPTLCELSSRSVHPRAVAVANLKNMSYPERLKILGLTTLESRRLRGDLIEVFKIVKGFDNIDKNNFSKRHWSL